MNPKTKIILFLLSSIVILKACEEFKTDNVKSPPSGESVYFDKLQKEKLDLQARYQKQLVAKESANDSLKRIADKKKKNLAAYRFKANFLQEQLKQLLEKSDSTHSFSDSISVVATNYFEAENKQDTACNETIHSLEQIVANRDSTIVIYKQGDVNLRDLQKEQQLRIQQLTDELNTAYKVLKKKNRQHKILSGALVFLSGLTTTFIVTQSLK